MERATAAVNELSRRQPKPEAFERTVRLLASLCLSLILLGSTGSAPGQDAQCPVDDYDCLDRQFGLACRAHSTGANFDTCLASLNSLLGRSDSGTPEVEALVGLTYRALAYYFSESRDVTEFYRQQAEDTFRRLRDRHPERLDNLYRLASIASSSEERMSYLRQAVEMDPFNLQAVDQLATALANIGGISAVVERIDIQERAYGAAEFPDQRHRLRLAFGVAVSYRGLIQILESRIESQEADPTRLIDAETRFGNFLQRAREDLQIDEMLAEISQAPTSDTEGIVSRLTMICHRYVLIVFGPGDCIETLGVVIETIEASGVDEVRLQLADGVAPVLVSLATNDDGRISNVAPGWRDGFAESLQRLMSNGVETAALYYAYYYMGLDSDVRLMMLQRGANLFPQDREIATVLGSEYLHRGMRDEAIEQWVTAWGGSLEELYEYVDEWLSTPQYD